MKRSEMVKALMGYLDGIDFSDCADNEELEDEAGYILGILEKKGMLPPNQYPNATHISSHLNEWETEDEKK